MDFKLLLWLAFFLVIFYYCVRSEILGQDCVKECLNQAPEPLLTDTEEELREKITKGTRIIYQTVEWRKALCLSILIVLFIFFLGYWWKWKMPWRKYSFDGIYPRGIEVIVAMLVLFVFLYFAFSWLQEHFWKEIAIKVRETSELI